jgi:hypothetical protein
MDDDLETGVRKIGQDGGRHAGNRQAAQDAEKQRRHQDAAAILQAYSCQVHALVG